MESTSPNGVKVFYYQPTPQCVPQTIDLAVPGPDGELVGQYSGESLVKIAARYKQEVLLGNMDDVIAKREEMLATEPVQIEHKEYIRALEVLPPNDWQRRGGWETYKLCEHYCGRITSIYAEGPEGCFSFNGLYNLTHEEIVKKCSDAVEAAQHNCPGCGDPVGLEPVRCKHCAREHKSGQPATR